MKSFLPACALITAAAACAAPGDPPALAKSEMHVTTVPNGTTCADLGLGTQTFTIQDPVDGTYNIDGVNSFLFRYYDDTATMFFFTMSTMRFDGVLVESNGTTAVWELPGANGWPSLHGAPDASGNISTIDSVSFCFNYELFLNPNAYAHYGVSHAWNISKTSSTSSLVLSEDQVYFVNYTVTLSPGSSSEAGLLIEGPVFINNPNPLTPRIDEVTVLVGDLYATVTCPVTLPYVLPAFTTLTCEFRVDVPDTSDRLVFVDVVSDGSVAVDRSLETASFSDHTTSIEHLDECIKVYDDQVPYADNFIGSACLWEGTKTLTYSLPVGWYDVCGNYEVVNTAWFEGMDTGATGDSTWTIDIAVPCDLGCTLTPGYWKTHSAAGPAPYDDTWALLPNGANTTFFLSGGSYYQALWTPPAGNPYWTLARAYIAAHMNQLNGASLTAVQATFNEATTRLQSTTPSQVAGTKALKTAFVRLAATLDDYNNGVTGPGHCDE